MITALKRKREENEEKNEMNVFLVFFLIFLMAVLLAEAVACRAWTAKKVPSKSSGTRQDSFFSFLPELLWNLAVEAGLTARRDAGPGHTLDSSVFLALV